jgi:hypothetical protein
VLNQTVADSDTPALKGGLHVAVFRDRFFGFRIPG